MKKCIIFGSADMHPDTSINPLSDDSIIIAADGGIRHIKRLGLKPDLFVGDMDSQDGDSFDIPNTLLYPSEKDDTDSFLAVKKALEWGCNDFTFYGCLGGSLRHTFANMQMLIYLSKRGVSGRMIDGLTEVYALHNGEISFDSSYKGMLSVFSFSKQSVGVTLSELKYPLNDAILTNEFPLGVSNEFIGKDAKIRVKQGDLILILEKME